MYYEPSFSRDANCSRVNLVCTKLEVLGRIYVLQHCMKSRMALWMQRVPLWARRCRGLVTPQKAECQVEDGQEHDSGDD